MTHVGSAQEKSGKTVIAASQQHAARTAVVNSPGDVDTIAALATPPGTGGIAVIRVSGPAALELAARVFRGSNLRTVQPRTAHFGKVVDEEGSVVDEVVATVFHRPSSYTGEDTVELSCHGGRAVAAAVLEALLRGGGRHALPGEFTKRSFLNGRIDLVQAEAVADLIQAETRRAQKASINQLEGRLSGYVREVRERLLQTASILELSLDFAEDDVPLAEPAEHRMNIEKSMQAIDALVKTYDVGRTVREGIRVVIIGRPNAGKSSLLNALLGMPRAIVTEVAGTTRDYLEEAAIVDGTLFRFVDTAGLRETHDRVEREGIARTMAQVREADIIIDVVDGTSGTNTEILLREERQWLSGVVSPDAVACIALNKIDLVPELAGELSVSEDTFAISAAHSLGLEKLMAWLQSRARDLQPELEDGSLMITNTRHRDCLVRAKEYLGNALETLDRGLTEEFVAVSVRNASDALGEIIGEVTTEDVLQSVFSRFCIGK